MSYNRSVRGNQDRLDRVGACASALCAVHCLLVSVALGLLPLIGLGFLGSPQADVAFFAIAISVGSLAIRQGYRHHRSRIPAMLFAAGLAMVLLGHFVFGHDHDHGSWASAASQWSRVLSGVFSVGGGLMLVSFHIVNARLRKTCCGNLICRHRSSTSPTA